MSLRKFSLKINDIKQYHTVLLSSLVFIAMTACSGASVQASVSNSQLRILNETQNYKNTEVFLQPLSSSSKSVKTQDIQKQAVQLIRHYYSAINRHDYKSAYADWSNNGAASQQSFEEFSQGFKNTLAVKVNIGKPGEINGAAGSSYIEIPVTIIAKTINGKTQNFRGTYVLKRVNDVTGSTPTQRMWHIYSAKITQVNQ
ncbi:hypothetical protein [Nostoc sp. FACHB-110]|uniref:hypothetical protein n=1 Tax=Nostoc sp. FACHB-110 TaxID=2692834 RepID=UPI001683B8E5|nr:hypothetical protein [Nostoc sp. FACHB-110]MBD2436798.1 hypothetical protein [Nostoc sp. FACHB-110]